VSDRARNRSTIRIFFIDWSEVSIQSLPENRRFFGMWQRNLAWEEEATGEGCSSLPKPKKEEK
jgi:hypothetical protein